MTSNLFVPHITHPTRVTLTTKSLIDNIFSNSSNFTQGISGNISLTISDYMAQFLIIPEDKQTIPEDINIYKRDHRNFDKKIFILDIMAIEWDQVLDLAKKDPNNSFNRFQDEINPVIERYLSLKKLSKREVNNYLLTGNKVQLYFTENNSRYFICRAKRDA